MAFFDGTPFLDILYEGISGSLASVWSIAIIVFPLMIALEFARDLNVLDMLSKMCRPFTKWMGVDNHAALPLAVGLIFGLSYGAGVIIQEAESGLLDRKSLILISVFLAACHAVIEDTLLFVAVGANGWFLLSIRLVVAFVLTAFLSRTVNWNERFEESSVSGQK